MAETSCGSEFMEEMKQRWDEQSGYATEMLRGMHERMAKSYKEFLERQLEESPWKSMESDWAGRLAQMFQDSMKRQREAREKFLQSQLSMVERYREFLATFGKQNEKDEQGSEE